MDVPCFVPVFTDFTDASFAGKMQLLEFEKVKSSLCLECFTNNLSKYLKISHVFFVIDSALGVFCTSEYLPTYSSQYLSISFDQSKKFFDISSSVVNGIIIFVFICDDKNLLGGIPFPANVIDNVRIQLLLRAFFTAFLIDFSSNPICSVYLFSSRKSAYL